jgi:uncharacterized protein (DUF342 family)
MGKREVTVKAKNEEEALLEGGHRLQMPTNTLSVVPLKDGSFRVHLTNDDARLELLLQEDRVIAWVTAILPPFGTGAALTREAIQHFLQEEGIRHGVCEEAITALLTTEQGPIEPPLVIAEGTEAVLPIDAELKTEGDPLFPFLPGMILATLSPAIPGSSGTTVTGEPALTNLPAPREKQLKAGEGTVLSPDGCTLTATSYGLAVMEGAVTQLDPLVHVLPDNLYATVRLFPHDALGRDITAERMKQALNAMGLVHGFDTEGFELAHKHACDTDLLPDDDGLHEPRVLVMEGDPPRDGHNAHLQLLFEDGLAAGCVDAFGRIDYRERQAIRNAHEGQILGRIEPACPGTPGTSLTGERLEASDGVDVEITAGEGVERSEDGLSFTATRDGMIQYVHNVLAVTDVMDIAGDIDYHSGNIHVDKGSVNIGGTIRDGFTVEVAGSLHVGEAIEGGAVEVGGDLEVERGIIMHEKGEVTVGGAIYARFVENANLEADGDLVVDNNITNSEVMVGGRVLATQGKGVLIGGYTQAGQGVEVNELGSEAEVPTVVVVGAIDDMGEKLTAAKGQLQEQVDQIRHSLGEGEPRAILERTPPEKREAVAKLLKAMIANERRIERADKALQLLRERERLAARAGVTVHRTTHPGVVIKIADRTWRIAHPLASGCIKYDPTNDRIYHTPL